MNGDDDLVARLNRSVRRSALTGMAWTLAWACWCAWLWHRSGGWWSVFYMTLFFLNASLMLVNTKQWRDARLRAKDYS